MKHKGTTGNTSCRTLKSEGAFNRPRRLWLIWNSGVNQEWHRDARAAGAVRARCGPESRRGPIRRRNSWGHPPAEMVASQCSFDVGSSRAEFVATRSGLVGSIVQVSFHDGVMDAAHRVVFASGRLQVVEHFRSGPSQFGCRGRDSQQRNLGTTFRARVQEFVLCSACGVDARVVYWSLFRSKLFFTPPNRIRGPVRESHRQHPPPRNATLPGNGGVELDVLRRCFCSASPC